jgi:hypothetical protein
MNISTNPSLSQPLLEPDIDEADRFLTGLDATTDRFCFQAFDDRAVGKRPELARTYHGTLVEHAPKLIRLNDQGGGIFITINEVADNQPRVAENITRVRALFIDADDPERVTGIEEKIARSGLEPTISVESSPGKRHYYWLINDCSLERFKPAQKALIRYFGTDKSVNDLPRVMRLPGFIHRKEAPFRTRIITATAKT